MMTIPEAVKKVIKEQLCREFDDSTKLCDIDADSLDMVELHMAIEDELGVEIPDGVLYEDGAAGTLMTVGELVAKVEQFMNKVPG